MVLFVNEVLNYFGSFFGLVLSVGITGGTFSLSWFFSRAAFSFSANSSAGVFENHWQPEKRMVRMMRVKSFFMFKIVF